MDYLTVMVGCAVTLLLIAAWQVARIRRRHHRNMLLARPFDPHWESILERNLPIHSRMPAELRDQLHGHIQVFLDEKRFEGCGGQEITDEVRVTIAGQACLLLLNRPGRYYPTLKTILVYPAAYRASSPTIRGGQVFEAESVRAGESWTRGEVVVAWDHVLGGGVNFDDGHNVVIHEFAHQLDQEDGAGDGAPILANRGRYSSWARVLSDEYEMLRNRLGHRNVMDDYGATNPAEFFAVATETFFEKPRQLHDKHPELYEELRTYYRVDPLTWE